MITLRFSWLSQLFGLLLSGLMFFSLWHVGMPDFCHIYCCIILLAVLAYYYWAEKQLPSCIQCRESGYVGYRVGDHQPAVYFHRLYWCVHWAMLVGWRDAAGRNRRQILWVDQFTGADWRQLRRLSRCPRPFVVATQASDLMQLMS